MAVWQSIGSSDNGSFYRFAAYLWVQVAIFDKGIGFLCRLKFFTLKIVSKEYLQPSLCLMLQRCAKNNHFENSSLNKHIEFQNWFQFWFSLGPSDAIWRQQTGSTLAQVMAFCLAAPSHYLNLIKLSSVRYSDMLLRAISLSISPINHCNWLEKYSFKISQATMS